MSATITGIDRPDEPVLNLSDEEYDKKTNIIIEEIKDCLSAVSEFLDMEDFDSLVHALGVVLNYAHGLNMLEQLHELKRSDMIEDDA